MKKKKNTIKEQKTLNMIPRKKMPKCKNSNFLNNYYFDA